MIVITDLMRMPIDEGAKVATFNILKQIKIIKSDTYVYSINGDTDFDFINTSLTLNKLFFDTSFYKRIRKCSSGKILYIPEASVTFFSFIRSKLLRFFAGKDIYVLALQPRRYRLIAKIIIQYIGFTP